MDRVEPENCSYLEFYFRYLLPGRPCIFAANLTENWRSMREWIEPNGRPNLKFLMENFGSTIAIIWRKFLWFLPHFFAATKVSVMKCIDSYDQPECVEMTLSDYIKKFIVDDSNAEKWYLKDWHFQKWWNFSQN